MYIVYYIISCMVLVRGAPPADNQKDQFCTDPRTMRKHAAYTEWADAYSCTRHRCQPGGRNLAIYTVGCKRVEAPESAIECEEVVEDTNMQFPYCCTRLRCLVVVRGEVWTRVLGQPWETLPAAPWSHMYKMKKPPPVDGGFQPKGGAAAGPIYELYDPASDGEQVMRTRKEKDCDKPVHRSSPGAAPDIVIALSTNSEKKPMIADIESKFRSHGNNYDGDRSDQPNEIDAEETPAITEKVPEIVSEERMFSDKRGYRGHKDSHPMTSDEQTYLDGRGQRGRKVPETVSDEHLFSDGEKKTSKGQKTWARIPQEPWSGNSPYTQPRSYDNPNDFDRERDTAPKTDTVVYRGEPSEEKKDKPGSLQTLVNAIGTRMRDIENVVQQMSEKVQPPESGERSRAKMPAHQKDTIQEGHFSGKQKKPNEDNYNRFPSQGSSRYLRTGSETTTEPPLFAEDTNMNGYFSDPSNNLLRRANRPKEPAETYMVPVNTEGRKKSAASETDEPAIKHKKHTHKKKKSKRGKKKHHRDDREEKKFNKNPPAELERNAVSLEESTDFGSSETEESLEMYARRPRNFGPFYQRAPD